MQQPPDSFSSLEPTKKARLLSSLSLTLSPFPASALTLAIRQSEWESDRHNCHRKCLTALRDIEFVTNGPCLSLSLPSSPALSFSLFLSQKFQPSIPNLVYQYHLFANYASVLFSKPNPEIPE
jgi:hypothetical protein